MQSNTKGIVVTIAAILVIAFFLPWITLFIGISAWDIVFGGIGQYANTPFKYLSILIPVSGALIVYGAAFNGERYALPKGLLFLLPLLTLIALTLALVIRTNEYTRDMRMSDLNTITSVLGIGFWLTVIASIILPFLRSRPVPGIIAVPVTTTDEPVQTIVTTPSRTSYAGRTKAGIVLILAGLVMIILSTQDKLFTKTYDTKTEDLSEAFNMMGNLFNGEANIDTKKKDAVLYSGIAVLIIGGVLAATGSAKPKPVLIDSNPDIRQNNP